MSYPEKSWLLDSNVKLIKLKINIKITMKYNIRCLNIIEYLSRFLRKRGIYRNINDQITSHIDDNDQTLI